MSLQDLAAERAVLAGLCQSGYYQWLEIGHLIDGDCFDAFNTNIFLCLKHVFEKEDCKITKVDLPTLQSAAIDIGITYIFNKPTEIPRIQAILNTPVSKDNISRFAKKIRKLSLIRKLGGQLDNTKLKLSELNGDESVSEIINIAEDGIFSFTEHLGGEDSDKPISIFDDGVEVIENVCENPVTQLGLNTGFTIWDRSIGGGLRTGVQLIGARMKVGKTMLGMNMGFNIANNEKIPVLYADSEMIRDQFKFRSYGMVSEVEINRIETGQIGEKLAEKKKVLDAIKKLKDIKYDWVSINGVPFEQQLGIIRKWILQEVGLLPDGRAKKCAVVYDYIKLNDSSDLQNDLKEYQMLGFMTNALHNICVRYDIPLLCFCQLNRDGIDSEETNSIGGSDRIGAYVSSFSIFKKKSDEEIALDGPNSGNRKLVPIFSRNGGLLASKEYINCNMLGWCGKITEGYTNLELNNKGNSSNDGGFIVKDNPDNDPHF